MCWGDFVACSGGLLIIIYSLFKMGKKTHALRPWTTRGHMSGWAILGWKSCISHKLIPQAGIMAKWVPADGGNKHLGMTTLQPNMVIPKLKFTHSSFT